MSNDQPNACVDGTTYSLNASYSDVRAVPSFFSLPPKSHHFFVVCIGFLTLHWLSLLITFKAIHGLAPIYLCDLLTFKSSLYNLRSSDSILLSMPAARSKTLGDRAFMVTAPRLWNSLPKELRAITNVNSFKAHIKTYLFKTLYWWAILYSVLTCMHIYSFLIF